MEYRSNIHKVLGLNDIKQNTPQAGAILLAKLQQKVARLEVTLRDKEAEFLKVRSSLKNTHIHELKLQTEVYYQEILRLKNELNLLQECKVAGKFACVKDPVEKPTRRNAPAPSQNRCDAQPPENKKSLVKSIEKLKDENERLSNQLSSIQVEKEILEADFDKILRKAKEEEADKKQKREMYAVGATQTSPKHEPSIGKASELTESALDNLKLQIEELQKKEKAWEEEKSVYKELILNLKEDRVFFKDTSQKRHEELWALQKELVKLQKDISGFQLNGKPPFCKQCTKSSHPSSKAPQKAPVKEATPQSSSRTSSQPSSGGSLGGGKPPKPKPSPVISTKRLPTQQNPGSAGSRSSSTSSRPSSLSSSQSHSPRNEALKSPTKTPSSPQRTSSSGEVRKDKRSRSSIPSAEGRLGKRSSSVIPSAEGRLGKRSSSVIPSAEDRLGKRSPSTLSSTEGRPEKQTPSSPVSSGGQSESEQELPARASSNHGGCEEDDEEIANEILRYCDLFPSVVPQDSGPESLLKLDSPGEDEDRVPDPDSTQIAPVVPEEVPQGRAYENRQGVDREQNQDSTSDREEMSIAAEVLLSLLEAHVVRRKKLKALKPAQIPPPKTKTPTKSVSQNSPSKRQPSGVKKSPSKASPKSPAAQRPLASSRKRSPVKPPHQHDVPDSPQEEPENLKEIDLMIRLLESHVARKGFLSMI